MKKLALSLIMVVIAFIIILASNCSGCKEKPTPAPHVQVDSNQLVIWKKPDVTRDSFNNWIDTAFTIVSPAVAYSYCANCDSNLVLVTAPDIIHKVILDPTGKTHPTGSNSAETKPSGDAGPAFYSFNFPVVFNDSALRRPFRDTSRTNNDTVPFNEKETFILGAKPPIFFAAGSYTESRKVTVAVFDTGVDSIEMLNYLYHNNIDSSCLGAGANDGWNFFSHNSGWKDDYPSLHGSVVAKLIIDQGDKYKKNIINILPVKIHSKDGISYLFDALCALQYARDRKADIINASFGYYSPIRKLPSGEIDSAALFFREFLNDYFKNSRMLMIAAAGNTDDKSEDKVYPAANAVDRRNLDSVNFFPASFAKDIPNIIAATTISNKTNAVSPHQNFSPHVIDIGVNADYVQDSFYLFWNPRDNSQSHALEGSSFATPVAAGKIAANYYLIDGMLGSGTPVNKQALLDILANHALMQNAGAPFANKIKGSRTMNK